MEVQGRKFRLYTDECNGSTWSKNFLIFHHFLEAIFLCLIALFYIIYSLYCQVLTTKLILLRKLKYVASLLIVWPLKVTNI